MLASFLTLTFHCHLLPFGKVGNELKIAVLTLLGFIIYGKKTNCNIGH